MKALYTFLYFLAICIVCIQANTEIVRFTVNDDLTQLCDEEDLLAATKESVHTASVLIPPFTEVRSEIVPGSEVQLYKLQKLTEGSSYEIRISYPAITPADFTLKVARQCRQTKSSVDMVEAMLEVTAVYTGVSLLQNMDKKPVKYNLVLERLYLGFFFYQAYKIIIAILAMVIVGYFILIPFVRQYLAQHIRQLDEPVNMKRK